MAAHKPGNSLKLMMGWETQYIITLKPMFFHPPKFLSIGNPTLSLESNCPDVVHEETEEDLEADDLNSEAVKNIEDEDDCNSIGGLREEELCSRVEVFKDTRSMVYKGHRDI